MEFTSLVAVEYECQDAGRVQLKWELELDVRSWGVKSLDRSIPRQSFDVTFQSPPKNAGKDDDDMDHKVTIHLIPGEMKFDDNNDGNDQIFPTKIDVWKGKVTIEWQR